MEQLAPGLRLLPSRPADAFNCYLVDDVLVDAATRWAWRRIERAVRGHAVRAHAITHAHADHQGSSARVCDTLGVPFWVGERDVATATAGGAATALPANAITRLQGRAWAGPGRPVDRVLREGDAVGSFVVLETPGHAPGHLSLWREADRVLIAGDVFFGRHPLTGKPGVHPPPDRFTVDPARNRASMRRLAELRPSLTCFGHGPPLRDPGLLAHAAAAPG
jgi:glyoxylase-like metal-dependent hydrolase (beta-lactamase superfamily II)